MAKSSRIQNEEDGLAYAAIGPVEIVLLVVVPPPVAHGVILVPARMLLAATLACVLLSWILVGWFREPSTQLRKGEAEIMQENQEKGSVSTSVVLHFATMRSGARVTFRAKR